MSIDAEVELLIVGAGPHGLSSALHLVEADPSLRHQMAVVDPDGWLGRWDRQFAQLDIAHLRSPAVHHPGPDASTFSRWCAEEGVSLERPYGIPDATAFRAHCAHLISDAGLEEAVTPTSVHRIGVTEGDVTALLTDGTTIRARHVVLAVNPARRRLPNWVFDVLPVPGSALDHAGDVDLRDVSLDAEHVVVVGGGLTAGHLAVGAARRGAHVTLLARRPLRSSMFDTDPGWLGPRELNGFTAIADPRARLSACRAARNGGSMPPWMLHRIRSLSAAGAVDVRAPARICGAQRAGIGLDLVLGDETVLHADRVWLATGTDSDVRAHRLTAPLLESHPTPVCDGFPVLDETLRWPGTSVHLIGRPAMLTLGPAAGNLWGARMGARAITAHLTGRPVGAIEAPAAPLMGRGWCGPVWA
ncbi:MAG: SidA/IucD/PvdA family monooxygenase [Acidimicrobiales bacterium]|nr:SidA/IucD/PvdA family monooxygenase [Acidimicrobiales bacterium]